MQGSTEYDAFADIYEVWVATAPITKRNLPFYTDGPVVELGVGSGRIAIEAARRGKSVIGVDNSSKMLELCRKRAAAAGVADRLILLQADMRDFALPEPAQLITIPFHSIGHLVSLEQKRACLRHSYYQLAPGGRFIFDFFVFNRETAQQRQGVAVLRAEYTDPATGHDILLWTTAQHNSAARTMRIITWTDELDDQEVLRRRQYRRLSFSWLDPEQARVLLEDTGFEVETVYGDFDRRPLEDDSPEHIWVARRPATD